MFITLLSVANINALSTGDIPGNRPMLVFLSNQVANELIGKNSQSVGIISRISDSILYFYVFTQLRYIYAFSYDQSNGSVTGIKSIELT